MVSFITPTFELILGEFARLRIASTIQIHL